MQQRLAGRILGSSSAKDSSNSSSRGPQQPTIRHLDDGDDEDDAVSGCLCGLCTRARGSCALYLSRTSLNPRQAAAGVGLLA